MCTLTWMSDQAGCRIFFNRDEKRTRLPAIPPAVQDVKGVRVLTPVDGNAGGSWMAVNEYGIAIAILNYYEADAILPVNDQSHESRGLLVLDLAACKSLDEVKSTVENTGSKTYRPFILTAFDESGETALFKWDGVDMATGSLRDNFKPVTTSSVKTVEVLSARRKRFLELVDKYDGQSDEMMREFQHSRDSLGGAYSVTMTRDDAQTVSYNEVVIARDLVSFYYQPREISVHDPEYLSGHTVTLKRA